MTAPVVHFEIIGSDPERLNRFYRELFGWDGAVSPTSNLISDEGTYRFIEPIAVPGALGVAGGIGGGPKHKPHLLIYVWVANVAEALETAERLGATRHLGPATNPEGNLVGVAGST